jgi:hypothetical protein
MSKPLGISGVLAMLNADRLHYQVWPTFNADGYEVVMLFVEETKRAVLFGWVDKEFIGYSLSEKVIANWEKEDWSIEQINEKAPCYFALKDERAMLMYLTTTGAVA